MSGAFSFCPRKGAFYVLSDCGPAEPADRYHSLAVEAGALPECLMVTAWAEDREVMAARHRDYPIFGVQFRPESILTPAGKTMLRNFIKLSA